MVLPKYHRLVGCIFEKKCFLSLRLSVMERQVLSENSDRTASEGVRRAATKFVKRLHRIAARCRKRREMRHREFPSAEVSAADDPFFIETIQNPGHSLRVKRSSRYCGDL